MKHSDVEFCQVRCLSFLGLHLDRHLRTMESFQIDGAAAQDSEVPVPITIWMDRLRLPKNVDDPLYCFIREFLHFHTPYNIFIAGYAKT
jgi:hypothetical protein